MPGRVPALPDADTIVSRYLPRAGYPEAADYLRFHAERFARLAALVASLLEGRADAALLDVGPSFQTALFQDALPGVRVDTIGYADERFPARPGEQHLTFDLNGCEHPDRWPPAAAYDVVVCAEVIEHLVAAPAHLLRFLATQVAPDGRIVLQTPNAASLYKRVKLLTGRHPYDQLRENSANAGHVRESTLPELRAFAAAAGLRVVDARVDNAFQHAGRLKWFVRAGRALPASLRDGITLVLASGEPR
jgi:hypothetical protein